MLILTPKSAEILDFLAVLYASYYASGLLAYRRGKAGI
jgi:hypothetical protein